MDKKSKSFFKIHNDNEQEILQTLQIGKASEFYFACRNGDIDTVKQLLPTIPDDQLNQLEPNGSTPLHAATYFGHLEIVRLLLHEYSCQRNTQNGHGFTAYEEAQTDEMRQLYHRPSNINRYCDESNDMQQMFQILSSSTNEIEMNADDETVVKPSQGWLLTFEGTEEIKEQLDGHSGVKTLLRSRLGRFIMKQGMKYTVGKKYCTYDEEDCDYVENKLFAGEAIRKILDEYVSIDRPQHKSCCDLLNQYIEKDTIESLLKLYTMETPFYQRLLLRVNPLAFPLFMHLSDLKQRHYQGKSYRGLHMTRDDLFEYSCALKNKDSIIAITKFASTSTVRQEAEKFADRSSSLDKLSVLFIFHFPQACDTAIYLGKINEYQLPCISFFENEQEVLVAPRTFFKVKEIEFNSSNGRHIIYLENIAGDHKSILGTLIFFLKPDLTSRY